MVGNPALERIRWNHIAAFGKDGNIIDLKIEALAGFVLIRVRLLHQPRGAEPNAFGDRAHRKSHAIAQVLVKAEREIVEGLKPVANGPPIR